MSFDARPSPRAAIRDWLSRADNSAKDTKVDSSNFDVYRKRQSRKRHRPRTQPISESLVIDAGSDRPREQWKSGSHGDSKQIAMHGPAVESWEPRDNEVGLAERLNLHAPFRRFQDEGNLVERHGDRVRNSRKRRRSSSSTTSYLEPAAATVHSVARDHHSGVPENPTFREQHLQHDDTVLQSSEAAVAPEKPQKSYSRRPRYKTRADRYELKQDRDPEKRRRKTKQKDQDEKPKKERMLKRNSKSGATLMKDFTANNVANDRLTLRPPASLGLFNKGKASSPLKRRGLPDLNFSEMAFMSSRRDKPEDLVKPTDRTRQRTKDKATDKEAEISRYFTSAKTYKAPDFDSTSARDERMINLEISTHTDHERGPCHFRQSGLDESPIRACDLPDRPFLGFGNSGASLASPEKPSKLSEPLHRQSRLRLRPLPSTRSPSCFTWSRSGAPSRSPVRHIEDESVSLQPRENLQPIQDLFEAGDGRRSPTSDTVKLPTSKSEGKSCNCEPQRYATNGVNDTSAGSDSNRKKPLEDDQGPSIGINNLDHQKNLIHISTINVEKQQVPHKSMENKTAEDSPHADSAVANRGDNLFDYKSVDPFDADIQRLLRQCQTNNIAPQVEPAVEVSGILKPRVKEQPQGLIQTPVHRPIQQQTEPTPTVQVLEKLDKDGAGRNLGDPALDTAPSKSRGQSPCHNSKCHSQGVETPLQPTGPSNCTQNHSNIQSLPRNRHLRPKVAAHEVPLVNHADDSRSAWDGYDAIYEQQWGFNHPQTHSHGEYQQHDAAMNCALANNFITSTGHDDGLTHEPAMDDAGRDHCIGDLYDDKEYTSHYQPHDGDRYYEERPVQTYVNQNTFKYIDSTEGLGEAYYKGQEQEPRKEVFTYEDEMCRDSNPLPTDEIFPSQRRGVFSSHGFLPFEREPLRSGRQHALYSRSLIPNSGQKYKPRKPIVFEDGENDASFTGFWKPHRLY